MNATVVSTQAAHPLNHNRLDLKTPRYDKQGDIENGFTLTGYSLNIKGNVFGEVLSHEGVVNILGNVLHGSIRNLMGNIDIGGFISHASVESPHGEVHIRRAENSSIRGKKVTVQEARNCTVLAEEVEIGFMQNTVVTGKNIKIRTTSLGSGIYEREENLVVVEVPDIDSLQGSIAELAELITQTKTGLLHQLGIIKKSMARKKQLNEDARVARYFSGLRQIQKLRQSGQNIDASILNGFAAEKKKIAGELLELTKLERDHPVLLERVKTTRKTLEDSQQKKDQYEEKLRTLSHRIDLEITNVTGETVVRKRTVDAGIPCIRDMHNPIELRREFGLFGDENDRIFHAAKGSVRWAFTPVNSG